MVDPMPVQAVMADDGAFGVRMPWPGPSCLCTGVDRSGCNADRRRFRSAPRRKVS